MDPHINYTMRVMNLAAADKSEVFERIRSASRQLSSLGVKRYRCIWVFHNRPANPDKRRRHPGRI